MYVYVCVCICVWGDYGEEEEETAIAILLIIIQRVSQSNSRLLCGWNTRFRHTSEMEPRRARRVTINVGPEKGRI
jgi:hypothetical protein